MPNEAVVGECCRRVTWGFGPSDLVAIGRQEIGDFRRFVDGRVSRDQNCLLNRCSANCPGLPLSSSTHCSCLGDVLSFGRLQRCWRWAAVTVR